MASKSLGRPAARLGANQRLRALEEFEAFREELSIGTASRPWIAGFFDGAAQGCVNQRHVQIFFAEFTGAPDSYLKGVRR
jgi:hypothetical protein